MKIITFILFSSFIFVGEAWTAGQVRPQPLKNLGSEKLDLKSVEIEGSEISSRIMPGRGWYLAGNVVAVSPKTSTKLGKAMGKVGSQLVFRVDKKADWPAQGMPVVYQPRGKRLAVVLGTIILHVKKPGDVDQILRDFKLKRVDFKAGRSYLVVRPFDNLDIFSLTEALSRDPRVQNASLNLGVRNRVPL